MLLCRWMGAEIMRMPAAALIARTSVPQAAYFARLSGATDLAVSGFPCCSTRWNDSSRQARSGGPSRTRPTSRSVPPSACCARSTTSETPCRERRPRTLPLPTPPACPGSRAFRSCCWWRGNASFGTATPSRSQIGSQPSDTVH
jgi:hypothetical protein